MMRLTGAPPDPASSFIEILPPSQWSGDAVGATVLRQGTIVSQPQDNQVELVMTNGTADYEHTYTFRPEDGKTIGDYSIVPVSTNGDVLTSGDVAVSVVDIGGGAYNVTTLFAFERAAGRCDFTLNFVDKVTGATVSGTTTSFICAGMSFFYTDASGNRVQVGGERGNLTLSASDLAANNKVRLETFVQYLDGTNSTRALKVGMGSILVSFSGLDHELVHDQNSCAVAGGTYDGATVSLPAGCGLGFSTNNVGGTYVGPQLGFDFEKYRNGSFAVGFAWDDLVVGTDAELESAGYETYLNVDIVGEVAPIVKSISPAGPYSGGDTITCIVANLPGDAATSAAWHYALSIVFGAGDSRAATLTSTAVDPVTGLTTLTYTLPSGSGKSLPWTFIATKPTGETLAGVDGTPGSNFTFSYVDSVVISGLTPSSGAQAGGTSVSVTGSFPGFDLSNEASYVTIGTTVIDKSLITSASETLIVFTTPAESTLTGGANGVYDVTITANGITSAPASFTYTASGSTITSLTPNSGSAAGGTVVTVTGSFIGFNVADSASFVTVGSTVIDKSLISSATETSIVFTMPAESSLSGGSAGGAYDVRITANGTTSAPAQFTFTEAVSVSISGLSPNFGGAAGGTVVTATGTFTGFNLTDGASFITIGTTKIDKSLISSATDTSIVFTMPAESSLAGGSGNGVYAVTITANGVASAPAPFTYTGAIVITAISPSAGPVAGGTTVTVTGNFNGFDPAAGSTVTIGGQQISAASIASFSSTSIVFTAPAQTSLDGTNSVFRFPVVVTVDGESSNAVEYVYEAPVVLVSMTPASGSEAGENVVTLTGQFVNYRPSTSGVYFGGKQIDDSRIVSYTDSQIVFTVPPRGDVGSPFSYPVSVTIGDLSSNAIAYVYESSGYSVVIDGTGGRLNAETGNYEVGACGNSYYRADVPSSALAQNATFLWALTDAAGAGMLTGSVAATDAEVFYLPYGILTNTNAEYSLTVTVATAFYTTTSTIGLVRLTTQNIGVKVLDPDAVSPGNPNTTLLIPADVAVPGCLRTAFGIDSEDVSYVWEFRDETYVFSHLNETVEEGAVGPTLLGREFKIPQEFMDYGTYPLKLTAYYTENTTIHGSDSTTVRIDPAALIATINAGQSASFVSQTSDVAMTGKNSRDPDVLTGDQAAGLTYAWRCRYSWDTAMKNALACGGSLLSDSSARSFTVSAGALRSIRNTTRVYIEYSLTVTKTSTNGTGFSFGRTSPRDTSVLILSDDESISYEPLQRIDVFDNLTAPTDPLHVKYYQDVIVQPISANAATTWTFQVLEPRTASTLLQVSSNLIPYPGFWAVGGAAGRSSLGLLANRLRPGTEYKFQITSSRPGFEENGEVLSLTTVQEPAVKISRLPIDSGTTNDTYIISAFTNYDGDFKFYFTLTDEFGFVSCVDGCQGPSVVRFRILSAGTYQVKCDVYDSLGYTLLASTTSATNITVTSDLGSGNSLAIFRDQLESTFVSGDAANYQQLGVDMVKYLVSNGGAQSPEEDSATIANFTRNLNQIVSNSVPNSAQSAGYVKTAAALAMLTSDLQITFSTEALYHLVNITINAVTRTPDTVALRQLEDLLDFYGTTPALVLAAGAGGTSRRRLLQAGVGGQSGEYNVLMSDVYEVMKALVGVVALKPASCGYVDEIATGEPSAARLALGVRHARAARLAGNETAGEGDERKTPAAKYVNPSDTALSATRWKVARLCNPEQGRKLELSIGQSGELCRFGWCKELFEDRFKNLYFMLVRTPNYVYMSGLRRNTTLTEGLHTIAVGQIRSNNTFVNAALPIDDCYKVDLVIPRSVTAPAAGSVDITVEEAENQAPQACRLAPEKVWDVNDKDLRRYYNGVFFPDSNTSVADSSQDPSLSVASFTTSATGIYTIATRIAWDGGLFSLDGYFLNIAEITGVTLSVLAFLAMSAVAAWMVATKLVTYIGAAPPVEADFTYVERDVYGRGTAIEMMDARENSLFV
jgi:REJ domain/IPT/TIG domain